MRKLIENNEKILSTLVALIQAAQARVTYRLGIRKHAARVKKRVQSFRAR